MKRKAITGNPIPNSGFAMFKELIKTDLLLGKILPLLYMHEQIPTIPDNLRAEKNEDERPWERG